MQEEKIPSLSSYIAQSPYPIIDGLNFLLNCQQIRLCRTEFNLEDGGCVTFPRKFYVGDSEGRPILEALEHSNWLKRFCFPTSHNLDIDFHDADGHSVLCVKKSFACSPCYCCNPPTVKVYSGKSYFGSVSQCGIFPRRCFTLRDCENSPQLSISGPSCRQSVYIDGIFKVRCYSRKSSTLGRITVQRLGGLDNYTISFPSDLDLRMKSLLIATSILLDYTFA